MQKSDHPFHFWAMFLSLFYQSNRIIITTQTFTTMKIGFKNTCAGDDNVDLSDDFGEFYQPEAVHAV